MKRNLLSVLPRSIHNRFAEGTALRKTAANTGWLMFEHICRLGIGLVVSVLIARHLGPHDFGILSYALSVTAFLGTFVYLGLGGIVVRDIIKNPDETGLLMGSSFALKMAGACLSYAVLLILAFWGHSSNVETWVLLIIGASLLFRPLETIDFWFQSRTESKYSVLGKGTAFFLASVGNLVLLLAGASLVAFAWVSLAQFVLAAILLVVVYRYKGQTVRSWIIQLSKMLGLLTQSWVLILSGFLALVYLKVDQIMLRWMVGAVEVGVYSVAVRFSEVWYFIPWAMAVSVFPKLTEIRQKNKKKYDKKLQQGFDILFAVSFSIAIVMTFMGTPVIGKLYGLEYERAGGILAIHVWAGVFIFMRALFSKWVIMENLLVYSLFSHGIGAIVNVILNLLLIKHYGGYGAAIATLISYATASYLVLFLAPRTWPIARMMSKSILLPVRLLLYRDRVWT